MKEKIIKISLIILFIMFCINFSNTYAAFTDVNIGSLTTENTEGLNGISNIFEDIIYVISLVGSGVSIIALIALGIKYMIGTLEEKANYKKTLLPYVIGAVFVFGASVIPTMIYNIVK